MKQNFLSKKFCVNIRNEYLFSCSIFFKTKQLKKLSQVKFIIKEIVLVAKLYFTSIWFDESSDSAIHTTNSMNANRKEKKKDNKRLQSVYLQIITMNIKYTKYLSKLINL